MRWRREAAVSGVRYGQLPVEAGNLDVIKQTLTVYAERVRKSRDRRTDKVFMPHLAFSANARCALTRLIWPTLM